MGFFDDGYLGAVVRGIGSNQKQQQMLDCSMFDISCNNYQRSLNEAGYSSPVGLCETAVDTSFTPETSPAIYSISKVEEIDLHEIFDSTSIQSPPLIKMEGSHSPPSRYSSSSKHVQEEIIDHVGVETATCGRISQSVSSGSQSDERNSVVDPEQQFPGDLLSNISHSVSSSEVISSKTWLASPKNQTNASAKRSDSSTSKQQGSKRRKGQQKRVVCVPIAGAEGSSSEVLPSDMWAWRKYGQKPIKGSPYPRGYYRCSSSKGCSARKQVERSRSDPSMLVVTYTSEHNHPWPAHRNSLAGTTRSKPGQEKLRTSIATATAAVHSSSSSHTLLTQLPSPAEESRVSEAASIVGDQQLLLLDNAADMASSQEDQILFQDLDELPELATLMDETFFSYRQYDDTSTALSMGSVDPFDLFCWSSTSL